MICPKCGNKYIKSIRYNHNFKTTEVLCKVCGYTWVQVKS